jgi:hypothetical protein
MQLICLSTRGLIFAGPLAALAIALFSSAIYAADSSEPGLMGHWTLHGDCQDSSGNGNHGVNHGVKLSRGEFDGQQAYIEVPASDSLKLGTGDFAFCAWIYTDNELDDIVGDVMDVYDPASRRGVTLSIASSSGGCATSLAMHHRALAQRPMTSSRPAAFDLEWFRQGLTT